MKHSLGFKEWLLKFQAVDLPIGDLAEAVAGDPEFPTENDFDVILSHIQNHTETTVAADTFRAAWNYYLESCPAGGTRTMVNSVL